MLKIDSSYLNFRFFGKRIRFHQAKKSMVVGIISAILCIGVSSSLFAQPITIQVSGSPQTVFDYPTDHCEKDLNSWQQSALDFPDEPARAIIGPDGLVQLFATNSHGLYRSIGGTSLDMPFKRDCHPILSSNYQNIGTASAPQQYANQLWIWSVWADEATQGRKILALIHNEFHGELNPQYCSSTDKNNCWYSNLIAAVSTNAGKSYRFVMDTQKNPQVTFGSPLPYVKDSGRHGMPNALPLLKNYFDPEDKNYYTLVLSMICGQNTVTKKTFCNNTGIDRRKWQTGMCVFRTKALEFNPQVPTTWLGYDNQAMDYTINSSQNPYLNPIQDLDQAVCSPVLPSFFRFGWSFNTVINQYIAIGLDTEYPTADGKTVSTVVYAISQGSLMQWDTGPNQHGYCVVDQNGQCIQMNWMKPSDNPAVYSMGYPTMLDSLSPSLSSNYGYSSDNLDRNFQFTGATPYLYYVSYFPPDQTFGGHHRDLMRLPLVVQINESN